MHLSIGIGCHIVDGEGARRRVMCLESLPKTPIANNVLLLGSPECRGWFAWVVRHVRLCLRTAQRRSVRDECSREVAWTLKWIRASAAWMDAWWMCRVLVWQLGAMRACSCIDLLPEASTWLAFHRGRRLADCLSAKKQRMYLSWSHQEWKECYGITCAMIHIKISRQ